MTSSFSGLSCQAGEGCLSAAIEAGNDKLMLYRAHIDQDGEGVRKTSELQLQPALAILSDGLNNYPPINPAMPKEETESWLLFLG